MNLDFYEPPERQRAGGLEITIRCLERFLRQAGIGVRTNPPAEDAEAPVPDVVHFHGLWQPAFLRASSLCRRRLVPYVVSPHGMLEPWAWRHKRWKKWPWYHLFERRHLSGAARLLATSEAEARNIRNFVPAVDCRALPLGLTSECGPGAAAARRKLGWAEPEVVLLFLSRLHPKKGLHLLLRALAGLEPHSLRDVRLTIVGGGEESYVRELRRLAGRDSARLPRVDWVGEVWGDERWAYLQGADLFCLPSFSENFGLAILEALQVGTRVLTTNRTPWEVVRALGAGTIVDATEDAIRTALADFLASPEWTEAQREALASTIHARFSWTEVGPAYLRFYEEIAANGRR